MSVMIKGMDVPSKCNMCPFADLDLFGMLWTCKISGGDISEEIFSPPFDFRPEWCPIGPERKNGKWIHDGHHIICDQCGTTMCDKDREGDTIPQNYCPNCGAKMEEEE